MGVIFKNNVMYGAGDIEISPVCYSEEEREIGCWTDGKPLYQKTIFPSISEINANSFSDSDFADAEMIMIIDGYYTLTNNYLTVALNQYETPQYWCRAGVRNDNSIYMYVNGYTVTGSASITVQYTKTTDTPGSGIWTPSGVPAMHYSTNEHVVGTWVDGSTLYERTYTGITHTDISDTTIVDANIKTNSGIYNVKSITGLWSIGNFGYLDATIQAFGETGIFNDGSQTLYARVTPNGLAVVRTNTNFGYGAFLTVQYTKTTS